MNARIRAQSQPWHRGVELQIGTTDGLAVVKTFIVEARDQAIAPPESGCLRLSLDDAQTLMDDLWQCGVRPTEGTGSAGSMAATRQHLEDMRAIAFAKLSIPKP